MAFNLAKIGSFLLVAPFLVAGYLFGAICIATICGYKWAEIVFTQDKL